MAVSRPRPELLVVTPPLTIAASVEDAQPSPLWMVTREPLLDQLVRELQALRHQLDADAGTARELTFSRGGLEAVRWAFADMIRRGEQQLHRLSELLCDTFLDSYSMESEVIGEIDSTGERFTLSQPITGADLYSTTDIDLGNRQLSKLRFFDGTGWSGASLVGNVVAYEPGEPNRFHIHRLLSRIKAEEEIWNKVVDEIFHLDAIVQRDKELRHLSRYVKDVFGIKIVVGDGDDARNVHKRLRDLVFPDPLLTRFSVTPDEDTRRLAFIETKDYLADERFKKSGWKALKSVVRWGGNPYEIQVQPLRNFLRERERLTLESHTGFRAHREAIRGRVAEQMPLFRFYRDLMRWLFLTPESAPPRFEGLTLRLRP